jgi:hypothetical protein
MGLAGLSIVAASGCGGGVASQGPAGGGGAASSAAGGTGAAGSAAQDVGTGGPSWYDLPAPADAPSSGRLVARPDDLSPWIDSTFDACQDGVFETQPIVGLILFVVDVSSSMAEPAPGGDGSVWEATRAALSQVVSDLPDSAAMGLVAFPNMEPVARDDPSADPSACVNTAAVVDPQTMSDEHRERLLDALTNIQVGGGRPTSTAYSVGVQALQAVAEQLPGDATVVVVTAGEPSYGTGCVGDGTTLPSNMEPAFISDTIATIADARQLVPPVETFVIGAPGSELSYSGVDARPWLSAAALAGGTAVPGCSRDGPVYCHIDLSDKSVSFGSRLTTALAEIVRQSSACRYARPELPDGYGLDPTIVQVKFVAADQSEYRVPSVREADCGGLGHGWYWQADGSIALCEATCSLLRADAAAEIELRYGCDAMI